MYDKDYPEDIQVARDVKTLPKAIRDKGENVINYLLSSMQEELVTDKITFGDFIITYNSDLQSLDIEVIE